jgi:hypothetical protein
MDLIYSPKQLPALKIWESIILIRKVPDFCNRTYSPVWH